MCRQLLFTFLDGWSGKNLIVESDNDIYVSWYCLFTVFIGWMLSAFYCIVSFGTIMAVVIDQPFSIS